MIIFQLFSLLYSMLNAHLSSSYISHFVYFENSATGERRWCKIICFNFFAEKKISFLQFRYSNRNCHQFSVQRCWKHCERLSKMVENLGHFAGDCFFFCTIVGLFRIIGNHFRSKFYRYGWRRHSVAPPLASSLVALLFEVILFCFWPFFLLIFPRHSIAAAEVCSGNDGDDDENDGGGCGGVDRRRYTI